VVESEPPEATATSEPPADDDPPAISTARDVGAYLWVGGLAGVTLTSLVNSSLLFWLSFAVFVLGGVLQAAVTLARRWRRESEAMQPGRDPRRLEP
jgi:membrane protein implicated in regulation of membrane protease activity